MKEVKNNKYLNVKQRSIDGGNGIIKLPRENKTGYTKATIIWSTGMGWDHVSVAPLNGSIPKWDDMCLVKDMFFEAEDCVVQYHPPKAEYINNMSNCLHLWRPQDQELPLPPSILTGIR